MSPPVAAESPPVVPTPGHDAEVAFFSVCVNLMAESDEVSKSGVVARMQELEMRARMLSPAARELSVGWAVDFLAITQTTVSAQLHLLRGRELEMQWRHDRAREEFATALAQMAHSIGLIEATLPRLPAADGIRENVPMLWRNRDVRRAVLPMWQAFEQQCGVELLLLQGRLGDYVEAVRDLARELTRTSGELLASGGEAPDVYAVSQQLRGMADNLIARSDAVAQLQGSRPLYQAATGDKVFIIHGHAEDKWRELRDLLEDEFGLAGRVIVLKEEASETQTVIDKFERHANQSCYAFALLTPDDTVKKAGAAFNQARQNVLFEMGWFHGRFGPSRLCILKRKGTALPSDLGGIVSLDFADQVAEQLMAIRKELEAAGVIAARRKPAAKPRTRRSAPT